VWKFIFRGGWDENNGLNARAQRREGSEKHPTPTTYQ
jgi:hypothetical protein